MNACSRFPCGMTTDGYCPTCNPRPYYAPNPYPLPLGAVPERPMGCICPPTSEQTCQNPVCPRKGIKISAGGPFSNGERGGAT